jgi:hypothetical protein
VPVQRLDQVEEVGPSVGSIGQEQHVLAQDRGQDLLDAREQAREVRPVVLRRKALVLLPDPNRQGDDDALVGKPRHENVDLGELGRLIDHDPQEREVHGVLRVALRAGVLEEDLGKEDRQLRPQKVGQEPRRLQPRVIERSDDSSADALGLGGSHLEPIDRQDQLTPLGTLGFEQPRHEQADALDQGQPKALRPQLPLNPTAHHDRQSLIAGFAAQVDRRRVPLSTALSTSRVYLWHTITGPSAADSREASGGGSAHYYSCRYLADSFQSPLMPCREGGTLLPPARVGECCTKGL